MELEGKRQLKTGLFGVPGNRFCAGAGAEVLVPALVARAVLVARARAVIKLLVALCLGTVQLFPQVRLERCLLRLGG